MSCSFPLLKVPSLFIAAPGDLEYLRDAAIREFEDLRQQAADDHGLQVYDWMLDKAEDGFKDWIPAQGQIPLPSDDQCRAVICLLGERIGTPLTRDFETSPLGPLDQMYGDTTRLVHPWVDGAEKDGGFALTGTVFEYLAALHANALDRRPPTMLLLVGDDTIREEPNPLNALWGGGRLRKAAAAYFLSLYPKGNRANNEFSDWENHFYKPQLMQLGNFVRYLNSRHNIFPRIVENEDEARREIRNFICRELDLLIGVSKRNPFKGLEAYTEADAEILFGRVGSRNRAVQDLMQLWDASKRPTFYGVTGSSGVGKSSMIRAALVGHLCHQTSHGRYVGIVMRPTDLLAAPASEMQSLPLLNLYRLVLTQIAPEADIDTEVQKLLTTIKEEAQPAFVVEQFAKALRGRGIGWRLLLGFDQFEELVDQWLHPDNQQLWAPVIELISLASYNPAMGVIYTLQTSRVDLISQDPRLGPLWVDGGNLFLAFPRESLDEIIRGPFRAYGLELEPQLVRELSKRINEFVSGDTSDSLLPLISLTLLRIFKARPSNIMTRDSDENRRLTLLTAPDGGNGELVSATDAGRAAPTLRLSDCRGLLDVSGAIAQLANEAVSEARTSAGASWSDESTIGNLLRRLVRPGNAGDGRLTLLSTVLTSSGAAGRLAEALTKRRLLLPEVNGHFKLVHETIFVHWPAAKTWLDNERGLLRTVGFVGQRAEDWRNAAHAEQWLGTLGDRDLDEAAEVLAQWVEILSDNMVRAEDVPMRDYALSLLKARPNPMRVVEAASNKPCHVHIACGYDALDLLKNYVEQAPECVNATRKDKRTPLFNACLTGRMDIIEILLQANAKVELCDENRWQPIHAAATGGYVAIVDRLISAGASAATTGGEWKMTLLHLAAINGHNELTRWLVGSALCDPEAAGQNGWTPLHLAAQEGHVEIIQQLATNRRALLEARLSNDMTPLHIAATNGRAMAVRALIALQPLVDARAKNDWAEEKQRAERPVDKPWQMLEWTPLHMAVNAGHEAAVSELLAGGADPNACTDERKTALMMAVSAGQKTIVQSLLKVMQNFELRDEKEHTAFHLALSQGQYAIAGLLATAGADVDALTPQQQITPLHAAVREGAVARVEFLLSHGASTAARAFGGRTPSHVAAMLGKLPMLKLLIGCEIERGAGPALPDDAGQTALHLAADAGHSELVAWLVRHSMVEVTEVDQDGMSALHLAARAGHLDAVDALLPGFDPNRGESDGWTPLMLAAQCGHTQVVSALLSARAKADAQAARPMMEALHAAAEGGHDEAIALLLGAGARIEVATADKPTALVLAVRNAQFGTASILLDVGAALRGPVHDPSLLIDMIKAHQRHRNSLDLPISQECIGLEARLRRAAGAGDPSDTTGERREVDSPSGLCMTFGPFMRWPRATGLPKGQEGTTMPSGPASERVRGPMYYLWSPVPSAVADNLCALVNQISSRLQAQPITTCVEQVRLPWYDGKLMFRLTDPTWPQPKPTIYYVGDAIEPIGSLYRLIGTSPPIHELNKAVPIALDESCVLGYIKFFCYFVRSEEGPFYILENVDDPLIPQDTSQAALAVIQNTVRPATLDGRDGQGNYLCSAVVWYANALFIAAFKVQPDGMIEMLSDDPIAAELPLRIDSPLK